MGPVLLALAVVAVVLAAPFASRRLRSGRVAQAAREAAPARQVPRPAGQASAPHPDPQPLGDEREPFAYDSGLIIGGRES